MSAPAVRRLGAPAVRRLGPPAVRKIDASAVRRLGARAVRKLSECSCCEKTWCSCCEKAECSCCENAWLVIARDEVGGRAFNDEKVVIINNDKFICVCKCMLLNGSGAVMVSIGR